MKRKRKNAGALEEAHKKYIRKLLKPKTPEQLRRIKKRRRLDDYMERQTWYHGGFINHLCTECRKVFKRKGERTEVCPECGKEMIWLGIFARVPKKNASDHKWNIFFKRHHIEV